MEDKYTIAQIWNGQLEQEQRSAKMRDYISAGDLGGSFLDRYYKMMGIEPTNPYEPRVLRIFSAGNEFHHLIDTVFRKIGILKSCEKYVEIPEDEERLKVLGYYDALIGGFSDWDLARERVKESDLSDFVKSASLALIDNFENRLPNGLEEVLCEIKSINSLAFWNRKNYLGVGYPHHRLQLYTYMKATGIKKGILLYVSKDDLMLEECPIIMPNPVLEEEWQNDVRTMTKYYRNKIVPEKEPDVVFNKDRKRYEVNWKLLRSPFLTKITGMKKEDFEKEVKQKVKEKNKEMKEKKKKGR
jgi:hypothetical protein